MEEDRPCQGIKRSLARSIPALFPHVFLVLSLIIYAVLGAWIFQKIEGNAEKEKLETENREFLLQIVETVRNQSDKELMDVVEQKRKENYLRCFQDIKNGTGNNTLQTLQIFVRQIRDTVRHHNGPAHSEKDLLEAVNQKIGASCQFKKPKWTFSGSLFFCCTVFTTVGYGNICPVTAVGRGVCMLYATLGIPLMLLVITGVGDILAMIVSKAYRHWHSSFTRLRDGLYSLCAGKVSSPVSETIYTFSGNVVVPKPLDIIHVMRTQSSVKHKATQYLNNLKIFESIITQEGFDQYKPLRRSCPELSKMPLALSFSAIGQEMERFNVPFLLIVFIFFIYILIWAMVLPLWEENLGMFEAFYFYFITITTIGFGDIELQHPKFFMLTFLFIITGMAIVSMAFKLSWTRIICIYQHLISCLNCHSTMRLISVWKFVKRSDVQGKPRGLLKDEVELTGQGFLP